MTTKHEPAKQLCPVPECREIGAALAGLCISGDGVFFRCAACAQMLPAEHAGSVYIDRTAARVCCATCDRIRQQQAREQSEVRL